MKQIFFNEEQLAEVRGMYEDKGAAQRRMDEAMAPYEDIMRQIEDLKKQLAPAYKLLDQIKRDSIRKARAFWRRIHEMIPESVGSDCHLNMEKGCLEFQENEKELLGNIREQLEALKPFVDPYADKVEEYNTLAADYLPIQEQYMNLHDQLSDVKDRLLDPLEEQVDDLGIALWDKIKEFYPEVSVFRSGLLDNRLGIRISDQRLQQSNGVDFSDILARLTSGMGL
jgi:DNA repair exonuclease SbcCD ATPase subunit